jgi:hypothetical protein
MKKDVDTLMRAYIENATIHGEATLDGDFKRGNRAAKNLIKIYKIMEQDHQLAAQMLEVLMSDPNINVRIYSSAHALGLSIYIDKATITLEEISSQNDSEIFGSDADMTLTTYKNKGYLKFY